jgi:hypothetical protein
MNLDIRLPLGMLFALMGASLLIYGLATHGSEMYSSSMNINLNVIWGGLMLCFGLVMGWFGRPKRS